MSFSFLIAWSLTMSHCIFKTSPSSSADVSSDLTGTAPEPSASSLAGITHDLALKTAYYTASVPIWLDLVSSPADWAASFLSDEAREVLGVLGGLVLVFALPTTAAGDEARELIRSVGRVVKDGLGGWQWDGVGLAIGVGDAPDVEEWDELSAEAGLEFVQLGGKLPDRNEFGGEFLLSGITTLTLLASIDVTTDRKDWYRPREGGA